MHRLALLASSACILAIAACAAGAEESSASGAAISEGEDAGIVSPYGFEGDIQNRAIMFALDGHDLVNASGSAFTTTPGVSAQGRTLLLQASAGRSNSDVPPVLAVQLPASTFTTGTIDCASASDLVFIAIPAAGTRLSSLAPPADGGTAKTKRACSVTFEQAIDWNTWASTWTLAQKQKYGPLAPLASEKRTLVRAHFQADLGPEASADVTSHVAGAFDLWDSKSSF